MPDLMSALKASLDAVKARDGNGGSSSSAKAPAKQAAAKKPAAKKSPAKKTASKR